MNFTTPWDLFDPTSPGSLARKHEKGIPVLNEDLAILVEANPDVVTDPLLRAYLVRGLRGELKGKPGRPNVQLRTALRMAHANRAVRILSRWYRRAARRGYSYALIEKEFSRQIQEMVARRMKWGSGPTLANKLSLHRNSVYIEVTES